MHASGLHYFPLALPFFLILAGLLVLLIVMLLLDLLRYAYARMGLAPQAVFAVLLLSLLGSYVNVPVYQLPHEQIVMHEEVLFFGIPYAVPVVRDWPGTVVAVNLGGAVIPVLLSMFLLVKNNLYLRGIIGIAVVAAVCHRLAYLVPGLGIAIPTFIPPMTTAVVALILSRPKSAPLAYISGSIGTLIGADLLNLDRVRGLGAPIVSIGGAGTFDGIFVTGLMAVIFASLATRHGDGRAAGG